MWLINVVVLLCGAGLGVVALTSPSSASTLGTYWSSGLSGVAAGLIASGLLGQWTALRERQGFDEVDLISSAYFALMVLLAMATVWLSLFMTFNIDEVKWVTKAWIYTHWAEFWASLSSEEQTRLHEAGGCSAEGHAMSALNDDCWEALKQSIFHSWKAGGLLAAMMAVLLPFNIFFAGTKIGWKPAMDAVQSVISFVSIGNGAAFLVLAFHVEGVAVVGCVLGGFGVIGLAAIQIAPNLFKDKLPEDFEEQAGKPLFFIYSGLAVASVTSGLYMIVNSDAAALTAAFGRTKLVSIHAKQIYASALEADAAARLLSSRSSHGWFLSPSLWLPRPGLNHIVPWRVCRVIQGAQMEQTMADNGLTDPAGAI